MSKQRTDEWRNKKIKLLKSEEIDADGRRSTSKKEKQKESKRTRFIGYRKQWRQINIMNAMQFNSISTLPQHIKEYERDSTDEWEIRNMRKSNSRRERKKNGDENAVVFAVLLFSHLHSWYLFRIFRLVQQKIQRQNNCRFGENSKMQCMKWLILFLAKRDSTADHRKQNRETEYKMNFQSAHVKCKYDEIRTLQHTKIMCVFSFFFNFSVAIEFRGKKIYTKRGRWILRAVEK